MNSDQLLLSNQICHRAYVLSNAITRAYRPLLNALDITYPQYVVMMALWEQDEIEINQLLKKTLIDAGAMSLILKKLQAKSLLSLTASEADKRIKVVVLTDKGHNLKVLALEIPAKIKSCAPSLTQAEINTFKALADKLNSDLLEMN
ncbi:MAG: MarR family transcriptional regulator [Oceanospirillaceae bacterium]|nr:MarR family transcriptional regulator [Oceanospirillaceae bacterium]